MIVSKTAPIIPNESLGGLRLRDQLSSIQQLVLREGADTQGHYRLVRPFEASYDLLRGVVEVVVDVRNGKIARLSCHPGYVGLLFDAVRIGMTVREAMEARSCFEYNEAEELILCEGIPGISLSVAGVDPDPADIMDMRIVSISVFAAEIATAAGERGDW